MDVQTTYKHKKYIQYNLIDFIQTMRYITCKVTKSVEHYDELF